MFEPSSNLDKLREIGIQEISQKTKISQTKVKQILNKEFEALERSSTIGFIRLIEKEFNISLQDFLEEYERYLSEKGAIKNDEKPIFGWKDISDKTKKSNIVLIILLFVLALLLYSLVKNNNLEIRLFLNGLKNQLNELSLEQSSPNQNLTIETKSAFISEENITAQIPPLAFESTQTPHETTSEINLTSQATTPKEMQKRVIFFPQEKVWMGIIFLDSGKKIDRFIEQSYELNSSRKQLIVFGKGAVIASVNDQNSSYFSKTPVRFYYDGIELKRIDHEEFMRLNNGKIW